MKRLWKNSLNLRDNLRRRMPKLATRYFEDGDKALAPGTTWDDMHRFRLRTKRFRYTIETFRELYGPGIEKRIDSLKKVQTYLGDINDRVMSQDLVKDLPESDVMRAAFTQEAEALTGKLREYWSNTFTSGPRRSVWIRYLSNYACRPVKPPATKQAQAPEPDKMQSQP